MSTLSSSRDASAEPPDCPVSKAGGRSIILEERIRTKLAAARNVLIVGVGGGNDAISSLLLRFQLSRDFEFNPEHIAVGAMLPDVLTYRDFGPAIVPGVSEILPETTRYAGEKLLKAFPEPVLSAHKEELGVESVLGFSMTHGSRGVAQSLGFLVAEKKFDLILGCDVGGDFITVPGNTRVLSPMMDSYGFCAFRSLLDREISASFLFGVFGLGTDGESSPEVLRNVLAALDGYHSGTFEPQAVEGVEAFYRSAIEGNRPSRTADFTFRTIRGEDPGAVMFRARFHTMPDNGVRNVYYGEFEHAVSPEFAGRYYLFDDIRHLRNPYAIECGCGLEWFLKLQKIARGINNEFNGQSYPKIEEVAPIPLSNRSHSLFFGTPSIFFEGSTREDIIDDILMSVRNRVYDLAVMYTSDLEGACLTTLSVEEIFDGLSLVSTYPEKEIARALAGIAGEE